MAENQPSTPGLPECAKPFADTLLGQLPTETLQIVARCFFPAELTLLARVSPKLRDLAEFCLYGIITLNYAQSYQLSRTGTEHYKLFNGLRPLLRTFTERPELALLVKQMVLNVPDRWPSHLYDNLADGHRSESDCEVYLAGAILQQVKNVARLSLSILDATTDFPVTQNSIDVLSPSFGPLVHSNSSVDFLQKVTYLKWDCAVFHWLMVSPSLKFLYFMQPCAILPDNAPHQKNNELELFYFVTNSSVLSPGSAQARNSRLFFEHFTSLKTAYLEIDDSGEDQDEDMGTEIVNFDNEGSFAVLMACLDPFFDTLTRLCIRVTPGHTEWVSNTLPSEGFSRFQRLTSLEVPYQCLFGRPFDRWTHLNLTPAMLFPPTLEYLQISSPKIDILDWFVRFQYFRDDVRNLKEVIMTCLAPHGDGYNLFAFESHPHPALQMLKFLNIEMSIYSHDTWCKDWDDYELAALGLVEWQRSLHPYLTRKSPIVGPVELNSHGDM